MKTMTKKMPIIGITPQIDYETGEYKVTAPYTNCLLRAGATPLILPFAEDQAELERLTALCDGFLLTGGHDLHPSYYGEPMQDNCNQPASIRDALESRLVPMILASRKPLLAVCRGVQVLNVFCGGTLYQDIHAQEVTEKSHRQPDTPEAHTVTCVEGTLAAELLGTSPIAVNTLHHQAVKDVGKGLRVAAYSEDGLIEALDIPDHPFALGVQWHPEMMAASHPQQMALFHRFVAQAQS